jgi:MoaA/NifB/PqqE/SkfB family radical SAM enzyme
MTNKPIFNTVWIQQQKPANFDDIDHDLKYKRDVYNLPKIKQGITTQCKYPWNSITVDHLGRVFICRCDGWLPFSVGHVLDFPSMDAVFNSTEAKKIQQSINNKTYEFCATDVCELFTQSKEDNYIDLNLTIDISCNLSCPSCRERLIFINDTDLLTEKMFWVEKISSWVSKSDKKINLRYGGGDPFASLLYKKTFELFAKNNNVNFNLMTNGLLIKNNLQYINDIFDRTQFKISIDAATKETYEKVRRGGKWEQLIENLEYLRSKNKTNIAVFVIQTDNFKEIPAFIDFCKEYLMVPEFSLVQDWGTWHDFKEHCVHLPDSPYYEEFLNIIKDNNIKV